ncbi:LIF receptor subunit alpha a [Betta splendens]|uniref:LIF receptor subunit alpha a n=1 Tax=Betta splendens TaxID=158456 RepID=A0A6P7NK00_BETSP|nr:LIF receptor subunit alpha a [Betta splendens]XP_029018460.1 LIF receptor subunit alpha a [Betta splendens]
MSCFNVSPFTLVWLTCVVLGLLVGHTHAQVVLTVPQELSLSPNKSTQQLSISWLGGDATYFDLMILRTELNETVFYETVSSRVNPLSGRHHWTWTSVEPLECTSLSVQVRSRDGQATSEWSSTQILQGNDIPSIEKSQMFPQDRIVYVGSNTTFCCIVKEGNQFDTIHYGSTVMNVTRLSRRTYTITVTNQMPSQPSGTNVFCRNKPDLCGTVVFVGYPPQPSDFACETKDLKSAVCYWNEGRDTHLYGIRRTLYSLNNRTCVVSDTEKHKQCASAQWEGTWTLKAKNDLGQYTLSDSAEIRHRVHPVAPQELTSVAFSSNSTVQWKWKYDSYASLALVCEVVLTSQEFEKKYTFSGVGLQSAFFSDLYPDEEYVGKVRCGAQQNFWKWGNWSEPFNFKTKVSAPDPPDVWMRMNGDDSVQIIWKRLSRKQSHGRITGFIVTLWSSEEDLQQNHFSANTLTVSINLTEISTLSRDRKVTASIFAKNAGGLSQPANLVLPLHFTEPTVVSRVVYSDGGFPLSWQSDANAPCGYVVDWHDAFCMPNCSVEWIKVAAEITDISIESVNFEPGVRYNLSLYSCSSEAPKLLHRWQGYMQELVPSSAVSQLIANQQDSAVLLTWKEIPLFNRRGFLQGYNIYISNGSQLTLLANLLDPGRREYRVQGLSEGSYKFTVKAYTSAGEDTGTTSSITLETPIYRFILAILASLGFTSLFMVVVAFFCYKKRKWVKTAFYPDIPEPKLPGDWSRTQRPLDVKPSPHSMVHIVEKPEWDSSKEVLIAIPEDNEGEDGLGDEPADTDEPTSLRYYNQVVDERPIRPRFPDSSLSSTSSLDSGRTDVTYTGIQTSGSSFVFQLDSEASSEDHKQQLAVEHSASCEDGGLGYRPQMQPSAPSDDMGPMSAEAFDDPQGGPGSWGYKPQCSWHLDSPVEAEESAGFAPSLGSPTSVASTQFLLADGEEHVEEKRQSSTAATWFTNLLSSTKQ